MSKRFQDEGPRKGAERTVRAHACGHGVPGMAVDVIADSDSDVAEVVTVKSHLAVKS